MDDNSTAANVIRARLAIDPGYIDRLIKIESGGNPNAVTGSNRGLGQFGPEEERKYGITPANRTDPAIQRAAIERETQEHSAMLRRTLGRDPTPGETYLSHQQGIAGGPALLSADPATPAWQVIRPFYKSDRMAQLAVSGNIPSDNPYYREDPTKLSAGDFRNLWINKFERGIPGASGLPTGAQGAPTPPQPTGGLPAGAAGPSQDGTVPVAAANAAGPEDQLLKALQAMSSPGGAQQQIQPQLQQINVPQPPGLDRARALARIMGTEKVG